ncbi:MAG: type IV pilus assembly protein PilM [Nitrospinaceae bacterium]
MFLSNKTPLIAVDIGTYSVKLAQLAKTGDKFELLKFGMMPLKENCIVDGVIKRQEEVVETLTRLIKAEKIDTKYVVASIAGEAVIIKKIRVPRMTKEELADNIQQEAEQYIPFDIDDVSIDFQILPTEEKKSGKDKENAEDTGNKMEILLVAVQNETIESRTDILFEAGLRPAIIDLDVFAMANAIELGTPLTSMGAVAVLDLGESYSHLNILQNGLTAYTRDIPLGGGACTRKLMSKLKVPYKQTPEIKSGTLPAEINNESVVEIIVQSLEKILEEVEKSFEIYTTTSNSPIDRVFLSGGGALVPGVDGLFSRKLEIPVEILNPLKGIQVNHRKFDKDTLNQMAPLSAVVMGLATRRFDYK